MLGWKCGSREVKGKEDGVRDGDAHAGGGHSHSSNGYDHAEGVVDEEANS